MPSKLNCSISRSVDGGSVVANEAPADTCRCLVSRSVDGGSVVAHDAPADTCQCLVMAASTLHPSAKGRDKHAP